METVIVSVRTSAKAWRVYPRFEALRLHGDLLAHHGGFALR
jgi:hypothetical protein